LLMVCCKSRFVGQARNLCENTLRISNYQILCDQTRVNRNYRLIFHGARN